MDANLKTLRLIQELEEQLDRFPLQAVIHSHAGLVEQRLECWRDRLEMLGGPGRRYWDHPTELLFDEVGHLLGAMFVLLQAATTETVSIVMRIYGLQGRAISKNEVMQLEAQIDSNTGLSFPAIANAAANYYKHRFEWPTGWSSVSGQQANTVATVRTIGMSSESDLTENLLAAAAAITRDGRSDLTGLGALVIEDWRDRLGVRLRSEFGLAETGWSD